MNAQAHMARFLSALPPEILALAQVKERKWHCMVWWSRRNAAGVGVMIHASGDIWVYADGQRRDTDINGLLHAQG